MPIQPPTPEALPAPDVQEEEFVPDEKIETPVSHAWQAWKRNPNPANMSAAIKSVKPLIDRSVRGVGHASPEMMSAEAKRLAIGAIKSYDPQHGTALTTHVYNHLRPLRGYSEMTTAAIDRTRTDNTLAKRFLEARSTLGQTLNREPTDDEMTDHLKCRHKDLEKMRRVAVGEMPEEDYSTHASADPGDAAAGLWADYVYSELPPMDKKIFEMKTGRNGQTLMSTTEVAAKLGLSEEYVNRRAGNIAGKIVDGANSLGTKILQPTDEEDGE